MDRGFASCHSVLGGCRFAGPSRGMAGVGAGHGCHRSAGRRCISVFCPCLGRGNCLPRRAVVLADPVDPALGSMAIDVVVRRLASAAGAYRRSALGRYVPAPDILDRHFDPRHHIGACTDCFPVALARDFDTLVCCSDLEISVRRAFLLNRNIDHGRIF